MFHLRGESLGFVKLDEMKRDLVSRSQLSNERQIAADDVCDPRVAAGSLLIGH
jgi:hypothetical protein